MITILSASWGNEDKTSAIVRTMERGHKAISEHDTPDEWLDFFVWRSDGNPVRAFEDGTAFKEGQRRDQERLARKQTAESKLANLGITPEELRAFIDL